jgi:hypothetical protein
MGIIASTGGLIHKDLGANHHMWTSADLYDNNMIAACTRTASFTWFGGYIGTAVIIAVGPNDEYIAATEQHSCGVNGTAFGDSDRTVNWHHYFDPGLQLAGRVTRLVPVHGWRFEPRVAAKIAENAGTILAIASLL